MKHRWTKAKKERFLKALTETANVSESCRRVGMSRRSAYDLRAADRVFAELWDDATETAVDHLEREAWQRALEGHEEPVFQRGKKVGTVRKYSDRLLIFGSSGKWGGGTWFGGFRIPNLVPRSLVNIVGCSSRGRGNCGKLRTTSNWASKPVIRSFPSAVRTVEKQLRALASSPPELLVFPRFA